LAASSAATIDATGSRALPQAEGVCLHCGLPVASRGARFCCRGCETVYGLLNDQGLTRYYELGGHVGSPVAPDRARSHDWLEALPAAGGRLTLDVQGIHCAACVWLIGELFEREGGGQQIRVNPGVGRLELWVDPARFALKDFVRRVESFGYLLGPARKRDGSQSRGLALRLGITAALALNAMLFSFAFYFGLSVEDGAVYRAFGAIDFALATLAVAIGGSYFFRAALAGLRERVLHLDLPIALGIALSYGGSTWAYFERGGGAAYFDTVCTFIALMLLGKLLPQRLLEANQRRMLQDDGVEQLPQKRVGEGGELERVGAGAVRRGDLLAFAPGDLVAVDVALEDERALCSLDWITGEAAPQAFSRSQAVPAGAFNAGPSAFRGRAATDFADSPIRALLSSPGAVAERTPQARFIDAFSRWYVAAVLVLASATFAGWGLLTRDWKRALFSTIALLVVTCPCAIGLATPLAYELALSRLRRAGLFLRSAAGLEKLAQVRAVALDKTGTLTDGELALSSPEALAALDEPALAVLKAMVEASNHPFSRCLSDALRAPRARSGLSVVERAGEGLEAKGAEGEGFRLGSRDFCGARGESDAQGPEAFFVRSGHPPVTLAHFRFEESARPDAREEIAALRREGYRVVVLSGDRPERAVAMGASLGVEASSCLGGLSPSAKARWIEEYGRRDLLMLGDGINDALAFQAAWCSGTPAVHRPFVPARADFYYLTAGLAPIRIALGLARRLVRVSRANLGFALVYNAVMVAAAAAGRVTPLLAAVVMPLSSVLVVAFAAFAMGRAGRSEAALQADNPTLMRGA
jgi:Cu2+-exporting ATPase